jgi:hypothetical protein
MALSPAVYALVLSALNYLQMTAANSARAREGRPDA